MTTFASLVTSISGLTITGVNTTFDYTPESIGNADLPASFVRLPSGDVGFSPADCLASQKVRTIELVVLIKPVGLETAEQNFSDTVTMLDSVDTAVGTWAYLPAQNGIAITYSLSTSGDAPEIVGDSSYWAVIATIQGQG
jgi:hypothetical protein